LRNKCPLFALAVFCALFTEHALAHPGSGIVVDSRGQVFFNDTGAGVWKIDIQGKLAYFHNSVYHWMAMDENGYFAASKSLGTFQRITPYGIKPTLITSPDVPIAVGQDGNLYYAPYAPGGPLKIIRRTPAGKTSVLATIATDTEGERLQWVNGIAAGPDGFIYFTEN